MRFAITSIALIPLALSAPAVKVQSRNNVPELSVSQWSTVQSALMDGVSSLSGWSWSKADELVKSFEEAAAEIEMQAEHDKTIWQQLKDDPDNFSKIVKVVEFQEEAIKYLDGDKKITFFAPNNKALTPPGHGHHNHHHHHDDEEKLFFDLMENPSLATISTLLEEQPTIFVADDDDGDDDDDKKKRRREMLKKFIGKILQYHGLMDAYSAKDIAKNSTLETALEAGDGSFGGLQRRIKVKKTLVPPGVALNFYAYIVQFDKKASNGYFHTIEKPLIPPPDLFESLYVFPDFYSTFTSAAQGLDGTDYLTWHSHHHHQDDNDDDLKEHKGTPLATVFPPTNTAFGLLPIPLKVFLFSPFGEKALEKILGYHYIPNTLLMSELIYNATEGGDVIYFQGDGGGRNYYKKFELMTVINETVKIEVARYKTLPVDGAVKTSLKINGIETLENDVPARNGVFHPLGLPLIPPHKHHDHHGEDISAQDTWENWEQWLPAWINE